MSKPDMKSFKQFLEDRKNGCDEAFVLGVLLHEAKLYKQIPGTISSFRVDPEQTSIKTVRHSHVYAKPNGKGKQLYSVGVNGRGHDGCSNVQIPSSHADYFRSMGFEIPLNNILECILITDCRKNDIEILLFETAGMGVEDNPI
jgi:hypothetical protein